MINDCRVPVLSSAIDFLFELEPRPTVRGVRVQCFQTAKGYGNASSVRGKKRAIGWILQLLCGRTASVPHGEHEAPCGLFWVCSNTHTECLCSLLLLLPSIFLSIRVFSNESVLRIRWPKYWSFSSFSISPSDEYSVLISFRMDWLDLLAVQGTLKSLLQHYSSNATISSVLHSESY